MAEMRRRHKYAKAHENRPTDSDRIQDRREAQHWVSST